MSEISLRDYFAKLDQLINANAADEVIHHCRHILQYYPKNVTAYRFLGRALLINGRWDEANAALRRVLSVIPDDYTAHLGLSEVYDYKQKADDAIWHLERAFEQNPNNSQILDGIRALYRRYRNVDQAKVQLTAAAVARQALRNQQYEHAIDTLRDALERQPDRIDLRLLLAVSLWESGEHVEAAETALDVLQVLPDCLEANRILTKLWLDEDRPSDAQRYLNRVEAIDPYLAVELAQGQPAPDDAFRLEELDYVRSAQSELTVNRPDWLKDITAEVPQVDTSSEEDWSSFASSMLASSAKAQEAEEEKPPVDLFGDDATSVVEIPSSPPQTDDDEIPAEFAALTSGTSDDDLTSLTPTPSAPAASNPDDPMAWLYESGVELIDEEMPSPFEAAQEAFEENASDSLSWLQDEPATDEPEAPSRPMPEAEAFSWMQDYNLKLSEEFSPSTPSEPEPAAEEEEMPDWLKDEGFLDEALGIEQLTGSDAAPEEPDWLTSPSTKETTSLPEIIPPEMRPTTPIRDAIDKGDDLLVDTDWLKDVSQDEPQSVPGPRRGLTAMLSEANFDWLKEQQPAENDITSDDIMDEWLAQFGASESKSEEPPVENAPDWLSELDTTMPDEPHQTPSSDESPDWLSSVGDAEPSASEEEFSWMQDDSEAAPAEVPDWLSELQPAEASSSDSGDEQQSFGADAFDWSAAEAVVEESEPSDMPDWMADLEPTNTYEASSPATFERESSGTESEFEWLPEDGIASQKPTQEEEAEFAWLDEDANAAKAEFASAEGESQPEFELNLDAGDLPAEVPDWLSELQPQSQPQEEVVSDEPSAVATEAPDWLSELQQPSQESEPVTSAAAETSDEQAPTEAVPDWLSELNLPSESQPESEAEPVASGFEEESAVAAEVPDWLSELQQPQQEEEPDPVAASFDDDSWLNETPDTEAGTEEPSAAAAEVPDWLSELQPQAESTPEAEPVASVTDDVSQFDESPVAEATSEEQSAVAAEVPDWLSELQPQAETPEEAEPEPATVSFDHDSWLNKAPETEVASEEQSAVAAAEVPDWLSELQPQAETPEEAEPVASVTEDTSLESSVAEAAFEEPSAVAAEVPDWLSELQPPAETPEEPEPEPVAASLDDDSWLNETHETEEASEEQPAVAAEVPDWLSELQSPQQEEESEPVADSLDDGDSAEESDETEFQPMRKADEPEPALSLADEADDEDDYWLNDEEAELETANGEPQTEDDINEFEGLTVFPSDEMDVMRDENFEPVPASNAPDWLNAMVPGLDFDFEATEDEPLETEFESGQPETVMQRPSSREFDWVEEIVEEESRQPETIAAVAEPAQPRYVFSRPPSWLNEPTGPIKKDDELPDWPSDVPEWLR